MDDITIHGYIFKYTNFIYGYQERYFKIQNGNIFYYLSKESVRDGCRRFKQLTNFALEMDEIDPCRFDIVFDNERWCLRFGTEDDLLKWKNVLRAYLPMPQSLKSPIHSTVDMHKLSIMSQNMSAEFEYIEKFLGDFLGSCAGPVDFSTIEQTLDRCRMLEGHLKQLRAVLRLHQVKESVMSEDEWHDADDGDIQLDREMISELQKDMVRSTSQCESPPAYDDIDQDKSKEETSSPIWNEIHRMTRMQVEKAKAGTDDGVWELFCQDGAMKMYKQEMESEDGLMVDPLKAVHVVDGVSAREYIDFFFKAEYKPDWDDTLVKINVIETLDPNTLIIHQLHKKVWPAAQRESLFWTHFEDVSASREADAHDAYIVCNQNVERDDVPLTDKSCVRVGLTVAMMCQTLILTPGKPISELTRADVACRIYYISQVHPGGWVPTAALRQVYKREYPRFLRRFTGYVMDKVATSPLQL